MIKVVHGDGSAECSGELVILTMLKFCFSHFDMDVRCLAGCIIMIVQFIPTVCVSSMSNVSTETRFHEPSALN